MAPTRGKRDRMGSKPITGENSKISAGNDNRSRAERLLNQASLDEEEGRLEQALQGYEQSLELWLDLIKSESDINTQKGMKAIMFDYIERAENVKKRITDSKNSEAKANSTSTKSFGKRDSKPKKPPKSMDPKLIPDSFDYTPPNMPKRVESKGVEHSRQNSIPKVPKTEKNSANLASQSNISKKEGISEHKSSGYSEYEQQILEEMLDTSPGNGFSK